MIPEKFDGIVVGGGAAGMFAAITAARQGEHVLLLEKNQVLGKKLLITGKGRCNVTNACGREEVLRNIPRNGRFLYSALTACLPEDVMAFFESCGCRLKVERGNRVFPVSDTAQSVRDCLQSELRRLNVTVYRERVERLLRRDTDILGAETARGKYFSDWVILATGGLSYPATGSTGDGYRMAESLGHSVIPQEGNLVPLEVLEAAECERMRDLSLRNTAITVKDPNGKVLFRDFGELQFMRFGVSGPVILSASCHIHAPGCVLSLDLKPALTPEQLDNRLLRDLEMYRNRSMDNALTDLLPRAMIPVILERAEISAQTQANALTREKRRELCTVLKNFTLTVSCKRPVSEAIITSGGICVSEIDPGTMASRKVSGLYFAGEIIDCDAYTGGFNLQIAWATGFCAGKAAAQKRRLTNSSACTRI